MAGGPPGGRDAGLRRLAAGRPRAGYYVPIRAGERPADGLSLKVAADGSEVVGLMVEGYLADGLARPAAWLAVAPLAGVGSETLAAFGLAPPEERAERGAGVATFLAEVRAAWEAAETE